MARYTGPVCKLCRREGEKLFLKGERCYSPKCAIEKRAYPPGQELQTTARSCVPSKKPAGYMVFWNASSAATTGRRLRRVALPA
jgi:hypothetical protein